MTLPAGFRFVTERIKEADGIVIRLKLDEDKNFYVPIALIYPREEPDENDDDDDEDYELSPGGTYQPISSYYYKIYARRHDKVPGELSDILQVGYGGTMQWREDVV